MKFKLAIVGLFFDELTEFKRNVLEFLRQSLEDGYVTITRTRLLGPLTDRMDLQVVVGRLKPEEMTSIAEGEPSEKVRKRVEMVCDRAHTRFQSEPALQCNADMQSCHLRHWCPLDDATQGLIENAVRKPGLSTQATDRILKSAHTIADLDNSESLQTQHVAEAIQYRTIDRIQ